MLVLVHTEFRGHVVPTYVKVQSTQAGAKLATEQIAKLLATSPVSDDITPQHETEITDWLLCPSRRIGDVLLVHTEVFNPNADNDDEDAPDSGSADMSITYLGDLDQGYLSVVCVEETKVVTGRTQSVGEKKAGTKPAKVKTVFGPRKKR